MSPASNRSGSSTPVQAAPPVPSMVPVAPKPPVRHSTPMDTIEALRSLKTPRSANTTQAMRESTPDVRQLERQVMAEQMINATLTERLKELEGLPTQVAALAELLATKSPKIEDIERRLFALENAEPATEAHESARSGIDVGRLQSATTQATKNEGGKELPQPITKDEVETLVQVALQPVFTKSDELQRNINRLSANVAENKTNQQNAYQTDQTERNDFTERFDGLESQVERLEGLVSQVQQLADEQTKIGDRVTKLETTAGPVVGLDKNDNGNIDDTSGLPEIKDLLQKLRTVEDLGEGLKYLETNITAIDKELHSVKNDVVVISGNVKEIFAEQFDPFKAHVEEQVNLLSHSLSKQSGTLETLKEQAAQAEEKCPASAFSNPQLLLIQGIVQESDVATDLRRQQNLFEDLQRQVAHNVITANQAVDTVKAAIRNLEYRYDNISTDALYQKMANWVVQQYPTSTACVLQQLEAIRHEFAQVRVFTDFITRTPNGAQTLSTLLQSGPELAALVQSAQGSKELPGVYSKVVDEVEMLKSSSDHAHTRLENLADTVTGLKTLIKERVEELEKGKIKTAFSQLEGIQANLEALSHLDAPIVKDCFNHLPILFTHVGQIQWLVEDLSQNLPKGNLEFKWSYDLVEKYDIQTPFLGDKRISSERFSKSA